MTTITGDHCEELMSGCELGLCGLRRNCTDNQTAADGYTCSPCLPGYALQTDRCADIDECVTNATDCIQPQQQCVNTDGGYECQCAPGYQASDSDGSCAGQSRFVIYVKYKLVPSIFDCARWTWAAVSACPCCPAYLFTCMFFLFV